MMDPSQDHRDIQGLEHLPAALRGCSVTIGNFDGVHLGHQKILAAARALADAAGQAVAVMTFEPPPENVLRPQSAPPRITPPLQKVRLLLEAGADYVVTARSDQGLLGMSPREFIEQVLVGRFAPRHVVEGNNFFFGRERAGDVQTLSRAGESGGFVCHVVDPVFVELPEGPTRVSSSLVRDLVQAGRVEAARLCLGRPFTLYEKIVPGQGYGRALEFPTANLGPTAQVVPGDGVYAGKAAMDGQEHLAAISVGDKPTLGGRQRVVEAFLIGAKGNLYGNVLALSFLQRLRDQRRFPSVEALKAQIEKDVARVREVFR